MHAPRSLLSRLRSMPPLRLDALIGALVLLYGVLEVLLLSNLRGLDRLALGFAVVAAIATAVALRRRLPVFAFVLAWTTMLAADQVGRDLVDNVAGPYFATMLVTFTAGYVLEGRRLWLTAAVGTGAHVALGGDRRVAERARRLPVRDRPRRRRADAARSAAAQPHAPERGAQGEGAAAGGRARARGRRRRARGAHAHRGRAARRRRPRALRDDDPGRSGAQARRARSGPGARGVRARRRRRGARR